MTMPLGVLMVAASCFLASCTPNVSRFAIKTTPTFQVHSLSPTAVVRGTGCTVLSGSGFSGLLSATVGGINALSVVASSDTSARICPAASVSLGAAAVELGDGTSFTLIAEQLSIVESAVSVASTSATVTQPGASLTVSGAGFDLVNLANNQVAFAGGTTAAVNAAFQDRLEITVPPGAKSGPVKIQLGAVDPPSIAAASPAVTVLQPFAITSITPPSTTGAFVGETVGVSVNVALAEIAAATPTITVAGIASPTVTLGSTLSFVVPNGVAGGQQQVCIVGTLSSPCNTLTIRGNGHTDLTRAASCTTFNFLEQQQPVSYDYPYNTGGTTRIQGDAYILDLGTNAVQVFSNFGSALGYIGAYPLPPGGLYRSLVSHCGALAFTDGHPDNPGYGYVATIDDAKNAVVILPLDSAVASLAIPVAGHIDSLFVIDSQRIGVLYESGGTTHLTAADMLNPSSTPILGVDLGGGEQAMTQVETTIAASPTWLEFAFAVHEGGGYYIVFATIGASGTTFTLSPAGSPPGTFLMSTANLVQQFAWVPGTNTALWRDMATTTLSSDETMFLQFNVGTETFRNSVSLAFQTQTGGLLLPIPTYFPALSIFDASFSGYWFLSEGFPRHMYPSTYAALFDAPSGLDNYFLTAFPAGGLLTFPANNSVNSANSSSLSGLAFYGASGLSSWIGQIPGGSAPRHGVVSDGNTVSFYQFPFSASPPDMTKTTSVNTFSGFNLALQEPGLGGDTLILPDNSGTLYFFDLAAANWASAPAAPTFTNIDYWPVSAVFDLQVNSPYRNYAGTNETHNTAPTLLLDSLGVVSGGFVYDDIGFRVVDPATGSSDTSVALSSFPLPTRPTLTFTPFVAEQSNVAQRRTVTLNTPSDTCYNRADSSGTVVNPSQNALMLAGDERVDTFTSCYENTNVEATPTCAHDDPSDPSYVVGNGGGSTCTAWNGGAGAINCRNDASLILWPSSGAASIAPVDTGLCGNAPAALSVSGSSDPNTVLVLWSVRRPPPGFAAPAAAPAALEASVLQFLNGQATNLTSTRLGVSQTAVGLTPHQEPPIPRIVTKPNCVGSLGSGIGQQCDVRYAAYDAPNARWVVAIAAPSRLLGVDEKTLAVTTLVTAAFSSWEISPDGRRLYLLNPDQKTLSVYDNQAAPVFLGTAQTPNKTSMLRASGDGDFVLVGQPGGYCRLSD